MLSKPTIEIIVTYNPYVMAGVPTDGILRDYCLHCESYPITSQSAAVA